MSDDTPIRKFLRRRSPRDVERELRVDKSQDRLPGGAEGGDESPAADRVGALPAKDGTALGDTDQHSA